MWTQGAALALEDAIVLAERLAEQPDPDRALAEFEARPPPRVAHVRTMTDRMSRSVRLPAWLRDAIMPVLGPRSYRTTYGMLREAS